VSNTTVDCSGSASSVSCSGSTTTKEMSAPARSVAYDVTGATLSLQLPDGRVAVVNCQSKYNIWAENFRSCRIPLVSDIQAEFDGAKAKLRWPVSIDGKRFESETYSILAVLDKP
jgi:hypothetical protein